MWIGRRCGPWPTRAMRRRSTGWPTWPTSRVTSEELSELLDEGSEHAGELLTRRAVAAHDLQLQRLADAGSEDAEQALNRLLDA